MVAVAADAAAPRRAPALRSTSMTTAADAARDALDEPAAAEVDLLGALAYGELSSFLRLSAEAVTGPTLADVEGLAVLGVEHFDHYRLLTARLVERGLDPVVAMTPFTAALDAFHARTTPSDWTESLVKAFVGDGIAKDFYLEVSAHVGADTRQLVQRVLGGTRAAGADGEVPGAEVAVAEFVVAAVARATEQDPQLSSRLALWGRRLVGEALSQAQGIVAHHPALAALLARGGGPDAHGADLEGVGAMFTRITQAHVRRMGRLGLTA